MSAVLRWIKKVGLSYWRRRAFALRNTRALAAKLGDLEARLDEGRAAKLRYPGCPNDSGAFEQLGSCLCRQSDFGSKAYAAWCARFGETPKWHRKQWEFFHILQSLYERGKLAQGMSGLGFGVGREPLPAAMAALGASVIATDLSMEGAKSQGWIASGLAELNARALCPQEEFLRLVSYREVDMNHLPVDLGEFDFIWSSCAFEHLGTLRRGLDFVLNSSKHLKRGGVAVHTTEYNLSSNDVTIESGHTSLYRKRDLEALVGELSAISCELVPLDLDAGDGALDRYIDLPPFHGNVAHLRRQLEEFAVTSVGLIVIKR